ncbi:uncharacterized protein F5891DRAFT_172719 [Suillus fuscotomentosus]|uniref:DUF6699 domain-containing protein n=1 Tax=Suillus fuscotomentosus TaxID=1912939 RepID=A0AAD4E9B1_9AGAM|nr:uncharacterized protein F5891DRAFT_172719 [Suillus fuscotomentosus]KAG1902093.1 hypothetical protein F5891DRAFT_172719 [Suillus fuscotomentosus]
MARSITRTHGVKLNPLFIGSPSGERYHVQVPIEWDVRYNPMHYADVANIPLLSSHLSQFATNPPIPKLQLVCDLLSPGWEIIVRNPTGVTVQDVLEAIYETLRGLLRTYEWEGMSLKQRSRIEDVHRARCTASSDPEYTRLAGVRRVDCLLSTTMFAGLTSLVRRREQWQVVLTLSRDFRPRPYY